jgi:hypothetical protein
LELGEVARARSAISRDSFPNEIDVTSLLGIAAPASARDARVTGTGPYLFRHLELAGLYCAGAGGQIARATAVIRSDLRWGLGNAGVLPDLLLQ